MPEAAPAGLQLRRLGGATALMMGAVLASRLIGFLRESYIAAAFGANSTVDAYVTAFRIPDWLNYLVAGGSLSITFITVLHPYFASDAPASDRSRTGGHRLFSVVATFMTLLLVAGIAAAEWYAPQLLRWYVPEFGPAQLSACVHMTRILLPAQLFFCVGGLLSGYLFVRGQFLLPALAPLVYNTGIIAGGLLLHARLGISSLAFGALAGAIAGPFLLPFAGAVRLGLRYAVTFNFRDPEFTRWLRLTLPLMIGVSLVTADDWIIGKLGAHQVGAISRLNYAKRLIGVPIAVLGQAVGQAAMPFFSRLATQRDWPRFRETLDRSVLRTATGAILLTSLLAALALPLVRIVYQHGRFGADNAALTAGYFLLFVLSLVFWSAQALYSRAFYATGDTLTPMVAGTLLTVAMIPVYLLMQRWWGMPGLAMASDTGIAVLTLALAFLLHRRDRLGFTRLRWREFPRLVAASTIAAVAARLLVNRLEPAAFHLPAELGAALAGAAAWLLLTAALARLFRLHHLREDVAALYRRTAGRIPILGPRGEGGP